MPRNALTDSNMGQTAIQNRSTDPKNKGARTKTAIIIQSWMSLNFTPGNPDSCRDSALEVATPDLRWLVDRSGNFMDGGVHVPHGRCRVVYQRQQLVVVDDLGIGDIHHVLCPHLEGG